MSDDDDSAKAVAEAKADLLNVRDEKSAQDYVQRMLRDKAFAADWAGGTHSKDARPGASEARARHEAAIALVGSVYQRGVEGSKIETPAQVTDRERGAIETEIQRAMADPAYRDKRAPGHENAVNRVAGLYQRLNTP
jgi:hypothetical protein